MATTIDGNGVVTAGGTASTQGRVVLAEQTGSGTNTVTIQAPATLAADLTFTMPTADGTNGQVLQTNGSGQLSFATPASASTPFSIIGDATAGAEIRLPEDTDNGSNYVALKAPDSLASNLTFTLPTVDGTNGQYLQTNGSGQLAFATVPTTSPAGSTGQIQINNAGSFGAVASGTAGQYLTSGGAGNPPTWSTLSSSPLELVASVTPTANIILTFDNVFTSAYTTYLVIGQNLNFDGGSDYREMQFLDSTGAVIQGYYGSQSSYTSGNISANAGQTDGPLRSTVNSNSTYPSSFQMWINNTNQNPSYIAWQYGSNSTPQFVPYYTAGGLAWPGTKSVRGFRLFGGNGYNFKVQGKILIFGFKG